MFEQAIYNEIENNFTLTGFDLNFGFGEVPENDQAPYIAQFSLNTSGDSQVLCNENDFSDGTAFIQWNVYHPNASNAFYIKRELMKFIGQIKVLSFDSVEYMIQLNESESSPSGGYNNGLFAEVVARSFTYNI